MDLQTFFPYRLALVSEAVSRSIAAVYAARFQLTRDEWRVLAALAGPGRMKTTEIAARTALDKMQVSRAVTRMERDGLIEREHDAADRRNRILRLLPAGRALFKQVAPMAEARERFLLAVLDERERAVLDSALDKLQQRAAELQEQG
ncbi:MAG TPA: MarR family transcriptional regulator [Burkholderiaceae bacterium]|nr:MarR family transcriptional regulator [Burkholderiaceae bacterium]